MARKKEIGNGKELMVREKTELVDTNLSLFGTTDYVRIIEKAKAIATSVGNIVKEQKLFTTIQGKKYVHCEGWTTMGALLGLFPQITEVREEKSERGVKYIADCEVRTVKGDLVSKAQSECASYERNKIKYDEYALRSMAETRAVSKAFRIALSWIMVLSGFQPTPAEEITAEIIEETKSTKVSIPADAENPHPKETKPVNPAVQEFLDTPPTKKTDEEKLLDLKNAILKEAKGRKIPDKKITELAKDLANDGNWREWSDYSAVESLFEMVIRCGLRGKK